MDFPVIPINRYDFKRTVCGIRSILDSALYRDNNTRELYSTDFLVLSCFIRKFVEGKNIYLDEQKISSTKKQKNNQQMKTPGKNS